MSVETDFLTRQWGAVSASPLPDAVKKAFEVQIVPLLKTTSLRDPYIVDATNKLVIAYFMGAAVDVLERNAATAEELEDTINGTLKTKLILKASTIVSATAIAAVALAVLSFAAGSALGGLGADSWNARKTAEAESAARAAEANAKYQTERLAFLERVNKHLMTCEGGTIEVQNGKKVCFYGKNGWYIE